MGHVMQYLAIDLIMKRTKGPVITYQLKSKGNLKARYGQMTAAKSTLSNITQLLRIPSLQALATTFKSGNKILSSFKDHIKTLVKSIFCLIRTISIQGRSGPAGN